MRLKTSTDGRSSKPEVVINFPAMIEETERWIFLWE